MKYKKYFTFSFDDGLEQDKEIVRILKEHGMQATFRSSWDRLKRFCEKMAGKGDIVYCNNREAFIQRGKL